jgi:hypothetical protein
MAQSEFLTLQERREAFANASLLVACIKDAVIIVNGILSVHLNECIKTWRSVDLG